MSASAEWPDSGIFEWQLGALIRGARSRQGQDESAGFALIVLNQPLDNNIGMIRQLWDNGVYF